MPAEKLSSSVWTCFVWISKEEKEKGNLSSWVNFCLQFNGAGMGLLTYLSFCSYDRFNGLVGILVSKSCHSTFGLCLGCLIFSRVVKDLPLPLSVPLLKKLKHEKHCIILQAAWCFGAEQWPQARNALI